MDFVYLRHIPVHTGIKGRQVRPLIRFYAEEPRRVLATSDGSRLWHGDITSPFPPSGNGGYVRNLDVPICRSLRVMSWRHRGPLESATSWTPSQPCGMQMLTSECVTDKCHARGCNLPTAPTQIHQPWCPQGPLSTSLLEIAKPLFLSPRNRKGFRPSVKDSFRSFLLVGRGRGGNLRHVSRPGSQDNVRVDRPEHKALFAYRKRLEVPDPFDGSERSQERCLKRQELQLDWVQRLKGAPLKSSQDDREVPRGHKGWPVGIHPLGSLQEPHDEIMLSQGPAVHCIVVPR